MEFFGNQSKSYLLDLRTNALNSFKAFAYQKVSVAGTAIGLTVPDGTKYCEIKFISTINTTFAVMYLNLGTAQLPTATDGLPLDHGTFFDITDYENINNFRAIQTAAGTHTLYVQYYR